jgi:16S rRNA (cytosine967-C5)-methyltransferase
MKSSARLSAVIEILDQWHAEPGPVEHRIRNYFRTRRYAGSKDRRWVTEFIFSYFRRQGEIRWLSGQSGLGNDSRLQCCLAQLLFSGADIADFEAEFLDGPHVQAPLTEVERNGLLSACSKDADQMPDWAAGNMPEWILELLTDQYGEGAADLVLRFQERSPLTVRVNTLQTDVDRVIELLAADDIEAVRTEFSPVALTVPTNVRLQQTAVFEKGLIEIQDEAAQVASLLTDAKAGQTVVDYCAGAGGKSLAIAAQMTNQGQIFAFDISERRMKDIAVRKRRAQVDIIEASCLQQSEKDEEIFDRLGLSADRVFVDAPCSGSGPWRRQPDQKWSFSQEALDDLISVQRDVLSQARRLVAVGGRLIYATCSVFQSENEAQVSTFLERNPDFVRVPVADIWKECGLNGDYSGDFLAFRPTDGGPDGFFAAVLERRSAS